MFPAVEGKNARSTKLKALCIRFTVNRNPFTPNTLIFCAKTYKIRRLRPLQEPSPYRYVILTERRIP